MRVMFDFQCPEGHVTELFIDSNTKEADCATCGQLANKMITPVRSKIDPISGDNVGATMKWMKMREQKLKQERKANSA